MLIGDKLFYAAVAALALWVSAWGAFAPAQMDQALPWMVPPLHARFLSAIYLSGTCLMLGAMLARRWATIRVIVPLIGVWTGGMFLVSLLHLSQFDFSRRQTWIWFGSYLVYAVLAAAISWRMRQDHEVSGGPALPSWLRVYLTGQGILLTLLATGLFCFPAVIAGVWPWSITPLLAQLYGGPLLSYGLASLHAARQKAHSEVRLFLVGTGLLAAGVLVASALHSALFKPDNPSTWIWLIGFGLMLLAQGLGLLADILRRDKAASAGSPSAPSPGAGP